MIVALLVLILVALVFPGVVRFFFGLIALLMVAACLQTVHAEGAPPWIANPAPAPWAAREPGERARNSLPLPYHNVEGVCGQYRNAGVYNGCIHGEQAAYDQLNEVWDNLPDEVILPCSAIPNKAPNFYRATLDCVFAWSDRYRQDHPGPRASFRR